MHHLNRLCFILPVDHDEIDPPPIISTVRSSQKRNRHRIRRWIAAFIHRLKLKWIESCRHPHLDEAAIYSQQFKDTDGIFLTQARVSCRAPRIFSYAELYIGSKGFSEEEVLGSGGFGRVFRAVLPSDGTVVAVKCVAGKGDRIEKTFLAELAAVAQLRHRNLVRLRGWCVHEGQLLLVYDYMLNRSLDRILFRGPYTNSRPLEWGRRRKIIGGLAAALFYLHEQLDTQIIHRDVKSSNVMLDSEFNARLGDFGLARWLEHDLESPPLITRSPPSMNSNQRFRIAETSMIGGTIGYLPPESFTRKGFATAKSDVFSFGIVVLEVVSGRRAVDLTYPDDQIVLVDWVRALSDERKLLDAGDSRLIDGSYALSDVRLLIHLGLLCSLHDPQSRPSMKWVMEVLSCNSFSGELPALPSFASQPRYISMSSSSPSATTTMATVTTITACSSDYETANGSTMFITAEDNSSGSTENHQKSRNAFPSVDAPHEIPYKEILVATNNFSESQMVAEMDFGTAYHGYLEDGLHIIVKRLGMKTCPALRARFSDELRNLGSLHHRHLVQLRGWCTEQGEMLVVYDYVPHRSLGHLLSDDHNQNHILLWARRYNIVKSLASAILYLHEEWEEQVIHRSITTSSIYLDEDMNPRLGSFALAEFLTRNADGHHVANSNTTARGIFGYMSPEYMETGMATTMADVYSFGVVIMEVVSGRKAVDFRWPKVLLVQKIRELETRKRSLMELVDWRLDGDYDQKELLRLVRIGLACTRSDPNQRPTMRQIVSVLDGKDNCLYPTSTERLREENREDWEERNASSLSLIRRIQALGIQ